MAEEKYPAVPGLILETWNAVEWLTMFWLKREKNKDRDRFYLLPGMGGRNLRRKQRVILRWSILAGIIVSVVLASVFYVMNRY